MTLGEKIKLSRQDAKLSRLQLAQAVGLDTRHILYIEKNERLPSLETLEAIAKATGKTLTITLL